MIFKAKESGVEINDILKQLEKKTDNIKRKRVSREIKKAKILGLI